MKINKVFPVFFFLILNLFLNIQVKALVNPTSAFYVNDYANILSSNSEEYIVNNSAKLDKATSAQIVVVTIKDLEGLDINTYATELYRHFEIGSTKENNGLLILISLEEREVKIEVGYGLEGVITDGLAGRYLDEYLISYLKEDKWDEGIINCYNAFYKKVSSYYNFDASNLEMSNTNIENTNPTNQFDLLFFLIAIFFGAINTGILKSKMDILKDIILITLINLIAIIPMWYFNQLNMLSFLISFELIATFVFFFFGHGGGYYSGGGYYGGGRGGGSSFHGGGGSSGGGGASRHF